MEERETLIQENARLKLDMVAMIPKLDSLSPRKASAIAEFDRLTEKLRVSKGDEFLAIHEMKSDKRINELRLNKTFIVISKQETEKQLIDCHGELRKLRSEKQARRTDKSAGPKNSNNNNNNSHAGNHKNCLTCRLLDKLQMGLSDCKECKSTTPCLCPRPKELPASIRREIEDFEVPWPEETEDWNEWHKRDLEARKRGVGEKNSDASVRKDRRAPVGSRSNSLNRATSTVRFKF